MTTIHPVGLSAAITQKGVELIDVRSRQEFQRGHIRGARSAPLASLHAAHVVRERGFMNREPLFVISRRRTKASLAAGMLRAAGCIQPVVIEGGMQLWETQGLPVVQTQSYPVIVMAQRLRKLVGSRVLRLANDWPRSIRRRAAERTRSLFDRGWWRRADFLPRKSLTRLADHFSLSK